MAKNWVVTYKIDGAVKTCLAVDVVQIQVAKIDPFGTNWVNDFVFFEKVDPPVSYEDMSLIARLSDIMSIREQF